MLQKMRYLLILIIEIKRFKYIFDKISINNFDFIITFCYTLDILKQYYINDNEKGNGRKHYESISNFI